MQKTICTHCKSNLTIKYGKKKIKQSIIQIYKCQKCNKYFSNKKFKYKNYSTEIILKAISFYNFGYTLNQTVKEMRKKFNQNIPLTTLHSWVKAHKNNCNYNSMREKTKQNMKRNL